MSKEASDLEASHNSFTEKEVPVTVKIKHQSQYPVLDVSDMDKVQRKLKQRHIQMSVSAVAWDLSKSANYLIGSVYVF
jgi:amino acid permease